MNENNEQRRAKAGGEVGANGEWYAGGKFIATHEDTIKAAPMRHEASAEEKARWAAWKAEAEAATARRNAWIAARCEQFRDILNALEASGTDQWGHALPAASGSFFQSLAQQLRANGSLSRKQADHAVKATLGRRNKKNAQAWDAAVAALVEEPA